VPLSFRLDDEFIEQYAQRPVRWGFPIGGGNSLGELTFLTKYSRRKPGGGKERWHEVCRRVVEGYYSILQDHCATKQTPWIDSKAQLAAQDAYERMFVFKWLPPGRGLWMMGTPFVHDSHDGSALQNCAFLSTGDLSPTSHGQATQPFVRLMEMSMLGIGVGFDTLGAGKLVLHQPGPRVQHYVVADSREGWCESVELLLASYFLPGGPQWQFDYSVIRPAGAPIAGFGGTAAGAEPLRQLHLSLQTQFGHRGGDAITSTDIVDTMNKIGKCIVAGNVRRTAELALGDVNDPAFLDLKDFEKHPDRMGANGWGFTSNNSVVANVGADLDHLVDRIANNGEPGLVWLDLVRQYGRLADVPDNRDYRAAGVNPCGEQALESQECCTLVETFPINCDDLDDFRKTLKAAYLYAKAVTLLPTHWPETNEVMGRNHRIGCSVTGQAEFAERHGWTELREWLDQGYVTICQRDRVYSEWLGVRESIKKTSVKPSGTVSLLAGCTPGVHWPVADVYIRRLRFSVHDPLVEALTNAGYEVEPDFMDPEHTRVVSMPTRGPEVRTERQVTVWEKAALAALHQRWWADNQVSVTLTFLPSEAEQLGPLLRAYDGQLKCVSMLPLPEGGAYRQMPYEQIDVARYNALAGSIDPIDWTALYDGRDAVDAAGEAFCTTDRCETTPLP
jgi:ribonucleoside-triphosphate reductase